MIITISVYLLPGTGRESKSTDHFKHSNVQPGPEQAFLTRTLSVESRKRLSLGTVHFWESLSKFSPRMGSGPPAGARRSRRFTVRIPAAPDIARASRPPRTSRARPAFPLESVIFPARLAAGATLPRQALIFVTVTGAAPRRVEV